MILIKLISSLWFTTITISFLINYLLIKYSIPVLKYLNAIDTPNDRSSHTRPTPKGIGIAIIISLIFLQFLFSIELDILFIICLISLTVISFINDYKQLSAIFRLIFQSIIIYIILYFWPPLQNISLFNYLIPIWLENIFLFFAFLWFINLFNFMDGIDGITGIQCLIISIGTITVLSLFNKTSEFDLFLCGFISGSSAAFLLWNWHPAKVFLGDAGSIPLGFINFILMLILCKNNLWFVAIILNSYYLCDSTYTLLKRIKMKKKPWEAHKDHFYQFPIQKGVKHSTVSSFILLHGMLMIILSISTIIKPGLASIILSLMIAGISTVYLLYYFKNKLSVEMVNK